MIHSKNEAKAAVDAWLVTNGGGGRCMAADENACSPEASATLVSEGGRYVLRFVPVRLVERIGPDFGHSP
jgi:hypothetical protein